MIGPGKASLGAQGHLHPAQLSSHHTLVKMTDINPSTIKSEPPTVTPLNPLPDFEPEHSYLVLLPGDQLIQASVALSQP